jgi:hypothetical protein
MLTLSVDSASRLLTWSNGIYVVGAVLTLSSAAMVLYEKHSKNIGRALKWGFATEIVVIVAAFISLAGTIGAIEFGSIVSRLKDVDLAAYKKSADIQIAQANKDAATANQKAQEAHDKAVEAENENLKLAGQVGNDAARARSAEVALEKANKATSDFAHALQQQQGVMAEQAKVSPVLNSFQIQMLAASLTPFKGQDVILHSTADTTVGRTKVSVAMALQAAGITFQSNSIDMGMLYQGVSVAVHSPQDIPPLANALVLGLRQAGIDAHPVAELAVPAGKVAIYFGPN